MTAAFTADLAITGLDEARFAELLIVPEVLFRVRHPKAASLPPYRPMPPKERSARAAGR